MTEGAVGCCQARACWHDGEAGGMASHFVLCPSSFQRRLESRKARAGWLDALRLFPAHATQRIELPFPLCGNGLLNHWIPRPSFQTRLYHLGRLFQTRLYHLHPCRRASMQAGLRRNDGEGGGWDVARHGPVGMTEGLAGWRATLFSPRRHSSEGWNPGKRGQDGWMRSGFSRFTLPNALSCHSRSAGMAC